MGTLSSVSLVGDLESALKSGSAERRIEMLRKTTDLFLSDADRLNEQQIAVFDNVLVRLMDHMEQKTLASLSNQFADVASAPTEVIRQLAFDADARVAVPVLEKSNRLTESDLVTLARSRGVEHLLAISRRERITEKVTDALIQRDEDQVSVVLAANAGAQFSSEGMAELVDRSHRNETLAEKMGLRSDLPKDLLRKLLAMATERLRAKLLELASPELRETIKKAIDAVSKQFGLQIKNPADLAKAQDAVVMLNRAGNLTESAINRFAFENDLNHVVASLALLTSVPAKVIEPLFENARPDGVIIACRAANLTWATTAMILKLRAGNATLSNVQLSDNKAVFENLAVPSAQRTIRFWSDRKSVV